MQRRLLVGLGNPGAQYEHNRHNIGFVAVDELWRRYGHQPWRRQFKSEVAFFDLQPFRIVLLKPQTYMNESGRAVQQAASYFNFELPDIIVFHDEIELPPAKVKVKTGGSDAGHNGLRSISLHVGNAYKRVRLGIGHPRDWLGQNHPNLKDVVHRHVLSNFTKDDRLWVDSLSKIIAESVEPLLKDQDSSFLNRVHLAMQAKGFN